MKNTSLVLSTLLLGFASTLSAEIKISENKDYVGDIRKQIDDNTKLSNTFKFQKIDKEDIQFTDHFHGAVKIENKDSILDNFNVKIGFDATAKLKGDYLINFKTQEDQKKIRGYGSIGFNFFDKKLSGNFGALKVNTPLISSKTKSTVYDSIYNGGFVSSTFAVEDYSFFAYSGYISHINHEMIEYRQLDNGLITAGAYLNDGEVNEMNIQVALEQDNYLQAYGDIINTFSDTIKIKTQFIYESNKLNLTLEDNYLVGGKVAYLYDASNYFSIAANIKKEQLAGTQNTYFHDNNVKVDTNGLYYNTLNESARSAMKISYKNKISLFKNEISMIKYFDKFDDTMFDDSNYEIDFVTKFSVEKYFENTEVKLSGMIVQEKINNVFLDFNILRADVVYKF
jgi:hypothetical protein